MKGGSRVIGSVEPQINNARVLKWGFIYALDSSEGQDFNVDDRDIRIDSDSEYVRVFETSDQGNSNAVLGESSTAMYFVRTMLFASTTEKEFTTKYKVRAYAQLPVSYTHLDVYKRQDHMKEVNKGWVVLAYKIKLYKPLKLGDEICVGTAPSKFGRVMANRQYFIKDNDGEYAVKAETIWAMIDLKSRMPIRISDDETKAYCEEEIFEELRVSRKLKMCIRDRDMPCFQ